MPRLTWNKRWSSSSIGAAAGAFSLLLAPLVVQAASSPTNVHVVQSGETLLQIALDSGTDASALASLNGLDDANVLAVGQSLKLPPPAASTTPQAPTSSAASGSPAARVATYTVADGDTLWDIAQHFGTTSDAIVQLNHLDNPDQLSLGAVLTIPGGNPPQAVAPAATTNPVPAPASPTSGSTPSHRTVTVSYTIQSGETLTQIAQQFDTRADAIAQASSLDDPNRLSVGSVLKVPLPAREHVVTAGETLRDIAASEKVDLGSLVDFNQLDDPELIHVGQVVVLPVAATQQAASVSASTSAPSAPSAPSAAPPASPAQTTVADSASAPAAPSAAAATSAATPTAASAAPTPTPTSNSAAASRPASAATAASGPSAPPKPAAASAAPPSKPQAPVATVAPPPPGWPTNDMAGAGLKLLGSPYVWGGSSPTGFDCSGFVWYVARQIGKPLSRGMFAQFNSGSHPSRDQLQVGDLVFFQNTFAPGLSHNGIYVGNGMFVHAADEAAGVTTSSLNTAYWSSHWFGATRMP
jgi:cell wall-associated NlpC family hydrolase/nucleoid-associated protein YgaU